MKNWAFGFVAAVIVLSMAGTVSANDIPASTLADMGLGGVHQMSDSAGTAVRGMGGPSVYVYGGSNALLGKNFSVDRYSAGGSKVAYGTNLSYAASISNHGFNLNGAFGGSFASR